MGLIDLTERYFGFLERKGKVFNLVVGLLCTAMIGALDYFLDIATGTDFTLAFFYLLPIAFVAWFAGKPAGIAISLISAITKISINPLLNQSLSQVIWRNLNAFAFFIIIALLLAKLRQMLDHEREMSRTDFLTGAVNSRAFMQTLSDEIYRQRRYCHPFALAYVDLDNFKEINDSYGHTTGNFVLRTVVETISANLRRTDVIARLGGDEFAILLPDTDAAAAPAAIEKIREQLHTAMKRHKLSITFSIGLLTCQTPPGSADEIITSADNLMYEAKKSGKNSVRHATYYGNGAEAAFQEA